MNRLSKKELKAAINGFVWHVEIWARNQPHALQVYTNDEIRSFKKSRNVDKFIKNMIWCCPKIIKGLELLIKAHKRKCLCL